MLFTSMIFQFELFVMPEIIQYRVLDGTIIYFGLGLFPEPQNVF